MDPPALPTPSFQLTLVTLADHHTDGRGTKWDAFRGIDAKASRELRYDQLCNMIAQEERDGYKCCDYLSYYSMQPAKSRASKNIDGGCRTSICSWMYRVADHFSIDREVVSIALSYIDRLLSANYCADRRTFKLISATSLHLAIKVHFPHRWQEVGSLLPELSRGDFVLDDLVGMEKELVHSLTWLMNPATSQSIAMHMLSLLPHDSSVSNVASMALFFIELSVCDYFFVTLRRSIVAIAAVLNASESAGFVPVMYDRGGFEIPQRNDWHIHIEKLLSDIGYLADWREISSARDRLWSLYRQSSEPPPGQDILETSTPPRKHAYGVSTQIPRDYPSPTSCVNH